MKIFNKQRGKDFKILNLTDTQLSNEEWAEGHKHRAILEYTLTELVKRVEPDLITVSGDLSWAGHDHAYEMLADFIDSFGTGARGSGWICLCGFFDICFKCFH